MAWLDKSKITNDEVEAIASTIINALVSTEGCSEAEARSLVKRLILGVSELGVL